MIITKKLVFIIFGLIMSITASVAVVQAAGGENWIDSTGNSSEPRNSRDVRNNTNGFGTSSYTPISFEGEATLYAQNYGYFNDDNYDIKLYVKNGGNYTQIGRLYGYGDALRVEVFSGHSIRLVFQRHQISDKYYIVELSGPFSATYTKDFAGEDTGFTSGNVYVKYGASGGAPSKTISGDNPSPWAQASIDAGISANIVPYNLRSNYKQPMTRAEFAALSVSLYESLNGEIIGRSTFNDTADINVQKAASVALVSGVGNNNYNPSGLLTREQAAVMLSRLSDAVGNPLPRQAATFEDSGSISVWARDAVGHVQAAGIMSGVSGNRFVPKDPYTREQSIATVMRIYEFHSMAADPKPLLPVQEQTPADTVQMPQPVQEGTTSGTGFISQDEALVVALKNAGVSRSEISDLEIEFEKDDGRTHYEISFEAGRNEYKYDIDAQTGNILDYELDD